MKRAEALEEWADLGYGPNARQSPSEEDRQRVRDGVALGFPLDVGDVVECGKLDLGVVVELHGVVAVVAWAGFNDEPHADDDTPLPYGRACDGVDQFNRFTGWCEDLEYPIRRYPLKRAGHALIASESMHRAALRRRALQIAQRWRAPITDSAKRAMLRGVRA